MEENKLEKKSEICPHLSNHCLRREVDGLSVEHCMDGSYERCLTYKVLGRSARGETPYLGSMGGFKR